jgi:hypothetical protein
MLIVPGLLGSLTVFPLTSLLPNLDDSSRMSAFSLCYHFQDTENRNLFTFGNEVDVM